MPESPAGDSGIRVIAAVLKQVASQTATTKPFGGDQTLTSTNQKFTLGAMDSGVSTTNFRVVVWQMSPGAYSLYVDGTNKGSSTSSLTPAAFDKVGNNFAGSIAEIIAYDRALSNGVRQKVEGLRLFGALHCLGHDHMRLFPQWIRQNYYPPYRKQQG